MSWKELRGKNEGITVFFADPGDFEHDVRKIELLMTVTARQIWEDGDRH